MPVSPLSLDPTLARIRALCMGDGPTAYHLVERAANAAAVIESRQHPMPAAFVLEPAYSALGEPNASSGLVTQEMTYEVGVLTIVQNYQGEVGARQGEDAEALRLRLWQALIGWAPEENGRTYDAGSGSLLSYDDQVFAYLDTFLLQRRIRNL